jgi:hypothetical protein
MPMAAMPSKESLCQMVLSDSFACGCCLLSFGASAKTNDISDEYQVFIIMTNHLHGAVGGYKDLSFSEKNVTKEYDHLSLWIFPRISKYRS